MKGQEKVFKNHRYASKVRVNGVTCVFVVHFRSSDTFKVCKLAEQLTSMCLSKHV